MLFLQDHLTVPSRSQSHWMGPLTKQVLMPYLHTGNSSLRALQRLKTGLQMDHLGAAALSGGDALLSQDPQCGWGMLVLERASYLISFLPASLGISPSPSALTLRLASSISASETLLVPSEKPPLASKLSLFTYSYQVLATPYNELHLLGLPSIPS